MECSPVLTYRNCHELSHCSYDTGPMNESKYTDGLYAIVKHSYFGPCILEIVEFCSTADVEFAQTCDLNRQCCLCNPACLHVTLLF